MELSLLWGAAAVDSAEYSFCMLWGSRPCPDYMDFAVALFPWGMEAGACWQLELALRRCKARRAEGEVSPVRAAGEESSRRVTLPSAGSWLACLHVLPHVPVAPHSPKPKWQLLVHTELLVSEPRHVAGISLFFLLPITLFVPGSVSGSAKLSLYPHCVLPT